MVPERLLAVAFLFGSLSLTTHLVAQEGESAAVAERTSNSARVDLGALQDRYRNAVVRIEFTAIANASTVRLNPTKSENYYAGEDPPHGSGFFITESDILTNSHVVEDARRSSIRIKSPATGNVEFRVEVIGLSDSDNLDLAVLRLPPDELARFKQRSGLSTIPTLVLGDSDTLKQADTVAIFGFPEDSDELKAIEGTVTGRQYLRNYYGDWFVGGFKFIEVGPASVIQPGNSGGPALNSAGMVVGIPARGRWGGQQGWMIPSNIGSHFLRQIYESEAGSKPLVLPDFGVLFAENFEGTIVRMGAAEDLVVFQCGIVVREVLPGSLAAKWGLQNGDVIAGFRNEQKRFSVGLDFEGNSITTGKFSVWPTDDPAAGSKYRRNEEKRHLRELFLLSEPGDDITIWFVRKGVDGLQEIERKLEDLKIVKIPYLGTYDRPEFALWGEFVVQDFNSYNVDYFGVPPEEVKAGGVLVTYVEPNGLAHRRGMKIRRGGDFWLFSKHSSGAEPLQHWSRGDTQIPWAIVESVNGRKVGSLAEFRTTVAEAETAYTEAIGAPGFDPAKKFMMPERYAEITFRTKSATGTETIRLSPAFPIDEAMATTAELMRNYKKSETLGD